MVSPDEMYVAAIAGAHHFITCLRAWSKGHFEPKRGGWTESIEACVAEIALCKETGVWWTALEFKGKPTTEGDAGGYQVRWTRYDPGHLILYEEDGNEKQYVLVRGEKGVYHIVGYMFGYEAKQHEFWRDPNDPDPEVRAHSEGVECRSWWVPAGRLHDFRNELR
jgi:hypothetical protein